NNKSRFGLASVSYRQCLSMLVSSKAPANQPYNKPFHRTSPVNSRVIRLQCVLGIPPKMLLWESSPDRESHSTQAEGLCTLRSDLQFQPMLDSTT
ncbi:hypothetical protein, partial [Endozoicomonas ascidiicola]|uniref:hypothetical protein n=1 Tax=Endozoicomonas ascidiicola TaxID=1698521 RepID=UPI001C129EFC